MACSALRRLRGSEEFLIFDFRFWNSDYELKEGSASEDIEQ
jgi:hypothetical protein